MVNSQLILQNTNASCFFSSRFGEYKNSRKSRAAGKTQSNPLHLILEYLKKMISHGGALTKKYLLRQ
jgi:hypothetical protein